MVFSSIFFIYYFLPVFLLIYMLVPRIAKNIVLLLASLFFYAWGEPKFVFLMMAEVVIVYIFGNLIEKYRNKRIGRVFAILSILVSLSFLIYFKYADFFILNFREITGINIHLLQVVLPIGISFYTFQMISYIVDVKRGEVSAQRSIVKLATYIVMFPQLIAGPIIRYKDMEKQLDERDISIDNAAEGIRRFAIGLGKKVIIANSLSEVCRTFNMLEEKTVIFAWVYLFAGGLQIYFDFSGYSDMAIGLGRILGFKFPENFNYPFISKSITEFWRRWHMTLGTWFRDYLYIPLGGNRAGIKRQLINILIVWLATGFWHGAAWTFILWGLYFAVFLVIEKLMLLRHLNKWKIINHVYLILLTGISFLIFNAETVKKSWEHIGMLFGAGATCFTSTESMFFVRNYFVLLVAAVIGATPGVRWICKRLSESDRGERVLNILEPAFILAIFIVSTAFLVNGSFNPFLYFRF